MPQVRLIDVDGAQLGIVPIQEALTASKGRGLDLVEVAPGAKPPVCKIMDYGKYKYQLSKKHSHKKTIEVKEVKIRPRISEHDLDRKIGQMLKFLSEGNKTKISMFFRGRERARPEQGMMVFDKIVERLETEDDGKSNIELRPKLDGRSITMVVAPK